MSEISIKEEPLSDSECLIDDIKIEETIIQRVPSPSPRTIIVESILCAMCRCPFERKRSIRVQEQSDLYKCNKCILHSRLHSVVGRDALRIMHRNVSKTKMKRLGPQCGTERVNVLRTLMYVCTTCEKPFERKKTSVEDVFQCNKCILHSRLQQVFGAKTLHS